MDLGERLQTVRKRRGLTQRELAESSRVSLSLIRKIEQGERDDIRMDTLRRFAVALGCPVTVLLGPDPAPPHGNSAGDSVDADTRSSGVECAAPRASFGRWPAPGGVRR
ncbi:helix-turn-helix domain-containing protein [Nocardia abscessus]|uniref:helix-turn-helix domain-containing protein n=1 Tax=Nocardia abscessus TaxID=120957 RepID=UPI002455D8F7|nr:helix-turn-helix transcriptional regulator [Nocardia abscessus]